MCYEKPTIVTLTLTELENARIVARLGEIQPEGCLCQCQEQCQCQCQCQGQYAE